MLLSQGAGRRGRPGRPRDPQPARLTEALMAPPCVSCGLLAGRTAAPSQKGSCMVTAARGAPFHRTAALRRLDTWPTPRSSVKRPVVRRMRPSKMAAAPATCPHGHPLASSSSLGRRTACMRGGMGAPEPALRRSRGHKHAGRWSAWGWQAVASRRAGALGRRRDTGGGWCAQRAWTLSTFAARLQHTRALTAATCKVQRCSQRGLGWPV